MLDCLISSPFIPVGTPRYDANCRNLIPFPTSPSKGFPQQLLNLCNKDCVGWILKTYNKYYHVIENTKSTNTIFRSQENSRLFKLRNQMTFVCRSIITFCFALSEVRHIYEILAGSWWKLLDDHQIRILPNQKYFFCKTWRTTNSLLCHISNLI